MPQKICEVCGSVEEHSDEEKHDIYGVCGDCMNDRYLDVLEDHESL